MHCIGVARMAAAGDNGIGDDGHHLFAGPHLPQAVAYALAKTTGEPLLFKATTSDRRIYDRTDLRAADRLALGCS